MQDDNERLKICVRMGVKMEEHPLTIKLGIPSNATDNLGFSFCIASLMSEFSKNGIDRQSLPLSVTLGADKPFRLQEYTEAK